MLIYIVFFSLAVLSSPHGSDALTVNQERLNDVASCLQSPTSERRKTCSFILEGLTGPEEWEDIDTFTFIGNGGVASQETAEKLISVVESLKYHNVKSFSITKINLEPVHFIQFINRLIDLRMVSKLSLPQSPNEECESHVREVLLKMTEQKKKDIREHSGRPMSYSQEDRNKELLKKRIQSSTLRAAAKKGKRKSKKGRAAATNNWLSVGDVILVTFPMEEVDDYGSVTRRFFKDYRGRVINSARRKSQKVIVAVEWIEGTSRSSDKFQLQGNKLYPVLKSGSVALEGMAWVHYQPAKAAKTTDAAYKRSKRERPSALPTAVNNPK